MEKEKKIKLLGKLTLMRREHLSHCLACVWSALLEATTVACDSASAFASTTKVAEQDSRSVRLQRPMSLMMVPFRNPVNQLYEGCVGN